MVKHNENPNVKSSLSQTRAILAYMQEGHTITPLEALDKFGSMRLSAIIKNIEKIVGYEPPRQLVQVRGRDAQGNACTKRVMSYWLHKES